MGQKKRVNLHYYTCYRVIYIIRYIYFHFLISPILEARAKILNFFCLIFGKMKTRKIVSEIIWPLKTPHFGENWPTFLRRSMQTLRQVSLWRWILWQRKTSTSIKQHLQCLQYFLEVSNHNCSKMKNWILVKPWKWHLFWFLIFGFWFLGFSIFFFFFINGKTKDFHMR